MRSEYKQRRPSRLLALAAVSYFLAAASPAAAEVVKIEINALVFTPAKITAHVGDTVQWVNKDFIAHSATARNHDWDIAIPANGMATLKVAKAGAVEYYCKLHPTMKGEIDVRP